MKEKYMILDFGKVIAGPATGDWDMTPKFLKLIKMEAIDKVKWQEAVKRIDAILSRNVTTLEEEEEMFFDYYCGILKECNYPYYDEKVIREIAHDRAFTDEKYHLYEGIYEELTKLKEEYTLIMLTDNWPCVFDYLKRNKLEQFFEKVYVSSIYGSVKKQGTFFDYPIQDYHIQEGEAIFVDDNEENIDVAAHKGFRVFQMDREYEVADSKYPVIHDLSMEIFKKASN